MVKPNSMQQELPLPSSRLHTRLLSKKATMAEDTESLVIIPDGTSEIDTRVDAFEPYVLCVGEEVEGSKKRKRAHPEDVSAECPVEEEEEEEQASVKRQKPLNSPEPTEVYMHAKRISWTKQVGLAIYYGEDDPRNVTQVMDVNQDFKGRAMGVLTILKNHLDSSSPIVIYTSDQVLSDQVMTKMYEWEEADWKTPKGYTTPYPEVFQQIYDLTKSGQVDYKVEYMSPHDPAMHWTIMKAESVAKKTECR